MDIRVSVRSLFFLIIILVILLKNMFHYDNRNNAKAPFIVVQLQVKHQVLALIRCVHGNLEGYDSEGIPQISPKQICSYLCLCFRSSYCLCFTSSACHVLIDDFVERTGLEPNIELSFSTHFTIETPVLLLLIYSILGPNKNIAP